MDNVAGSRETKHSRIFGIQIEGPYAMFADPVIGTGGERFSMLVPTYEALTGILRSIYWKPGIIWDVHQCRVCNPIQFETRGILLPRYNRSGGAVHYKDKNDIGYFTYLQDVKYQITASFHFDQTQVNLYHDFIFGKHEAIFERSLAAGGRRDIFLGRRECQGYVSPISADEWTGPGAYDDMESYPLGLMYHSLTYPNQAYNAETEAHLTMNMFNPVMEHGIITFPSQKDCPIHRTVREMENTVFPDLTKEGLADEPME